MTVHSYTPCSSRLALRRVSEKSPLMKLLASQLKPSFICGATSPNEAISEPLLIQLTLMRDWSTLSPFTKRGDVTWQGRVAFVFGLVCISLGDAVSRERKFRRKFRENKEPLLNSTHALYLNTGAPVR